MVANPKLVRLYGLQRSYAAYAGKFDKIVRSNGYGRMRIQRLKVGGYIGPSHP